MIVRLGDSIGLGALLRIHRAGADVWVSLLLGAGLFALAIVALFLSWPGQPYVSIGIGAISGLLLYLWLRKKDNEARLYEDGILYLRGGVQYALRWREISAIWQQSVRRSVNFIPVGTFHEYTLQTTDGMFVLKGDLEDVQQLGQQIQRSLFADQIEATIDRFNDGEGLRFGVLSLSRVGVEYGDGLLPWSQVAKIDLQDGHVRVHAEGKWLAWANVPVAAIPNFLVFWALVGEILPEQSGA